MDISPTRYRDRQGWRISNECISLVFLAGGGHLAAIYLADQPETNPLWSPPWKSMDPTDFDPDRDGPTYGGQALLAGICGHNLCLGWFGGPSKAEAACGHSTHGEAGVSTWSLLNTEVTDARATLVIGCPLPKTGLAVERTVILETNAATASVTDRVENLLQRDLPFTLAQHVTLGPPFLDANLTVLDTSATRGHTWPWHFEDNPRLKRNAEYTWPMAPGVDGGQVDLRTMSSPGDLSSDFSTQWMDPAQPRAWLTATRADLGLQLRYEWDRDDCPWLGVWEENKGRTAPPWNGETLCRGVEFTNTPFPSSLRDSVERGTLFDTPTYAWLDARASRNFVYSVSLLQIKA